MCGRQPAFLLKGDGVILADVECSSSKSEDADQRPVRSGHPMAAGCGVCGGERARFVSRSSLCKTHFEMLHVIAYSTALVLSSPSFRQQLDARSRWRHAGCDDCYSNAEPEPSHVLVYHSNACAFHTIHQPAVASADDSCGCRMHYSTLRRRPSHLRTAVSPMRSTSICSVLCCLN